MTADEPLAGSTRRAARGLRQDVETVWSRLRAELTLQDRFWVGFLFGAEALEVAELVARSRDLALSEVRRVEVIRLDELEDVGPALGQLLAPQAEDLAMTWIADVGGSITERAQLWTRLLRRLNERRDALRDAHPHGLVLVCPHGSLPLARDEAPDLWSFRSLTATLDPAGSRFRPHARTVAGAMNSETLSRRWRARRSDRHPPCRPCCNERQAQCSPAGPTLPCPQAWTH
jgi:hypothetical protein